MLESKVFWDLCVFSTGTREALLIRRQEKHTQRRTFVASDRCLIEADSDVWSSNTDNKAASLDGVFAKPLAFSVWLLWLGAAVLSGSSTGSPLKLVNLKKWENSRKFVELRLSFFIQIVRRAALKNQLRPQKDWKIQIGQFKVKFWILFSLKLIFHGI